MIHVFNAPLLAVGFAAGFAGAAFFIAGLARGAGFAAAAGFAAGRFAAGFFTAGFLASGFVAAGFALLAVLRSYTFLPATAAAAAVAITAPATAADLPGFSLMAVPAVAAALEAESTADLAVVDAVSAADRALPERVSTRSRNVVNTALNPPFFSGFLGIIRSSLGCNANVIIVWNGVGSRVLIGMVVR